VRDFIRVSALLFGLLATVLSLLAAVAGLVLVLSDGGLLLVSLTLIASLVAVGAGLGAPLAWAALRSWQRRPSPALHLPPAWWLGLSFIGLLLLGQLVVGTRLNLLLIPPLHVAVSLLPPLLVIAAVAPPLQRAGAGLTRRTLASQFSFGGLAGALLAILAESALAIGVFLLAGAGAALLPGGLDNIERLAAELQSGVWMGDPMALLGRLLSPGFVLGLGLLVAVAIPLLEEFIKSLGAPISGLMQGRLTRGQAFAAGVIAGAGFSFLEALFYAAQQLPHTWAIGVVVRALTVVIHSAATGLFALGWYEVAAGRPARFFPYAAGGVAIHAVWNGLGGLLILSGLTAAGGEPAMQTLGGVGSLLGIGLLALTWLAALAVLVRFTRRLSAARDAGHVN
jgi:hypothetical protein